MDFKEIGEVVEIDCGSNFERVNEYLQKGWVLLRIRTVTKKEGEDIIEFPIYILGKPLL